MPVLPHKKRGTVYLYNDSRPALARRLSGRFFGVRGFGCLLGVKRGVGIPMVSLLTVVKL
ncbi:hypothetical protein HMPREF9554_00557, partial [Treponema phagedenis F0421]